ncbi:GAS2-like protein 1 [Trichoplax sp. H2]|nr:GAS2-like protein 1 [Trichoplax sp. H2]|eukprot:RDD40006.1 GAS2-like protein 1 [Trichoplax sp. H2]
MVDLQSPTLVESQLADEYPDIIRDEIEKEYLTALKEDITEWINELLVLDLMPDNLLTALEDGIVLNQLAQYVHQVGDSYFDSHTGLSRKVKKLPSKCPKYRQNASSNPFFARDNISNFITWCKQLGVPEVIMFETEDLVSQKNIKSVLLCLLEISRIAVKYGVAPTAIIALENEMDKDQGRSDCSDDSCETSSVVSIATVGSQTDLFPDDKPMVKRRGNSNSPSRGTKQKSMIPVKGIKKQNEDTVEKSENAIDIDCKIQNLLAKCTCKRKFMLRKLSEGKYRVGEDGPVIFIRVLRHHIMVRVGGGWDTLRNYVDKHDPCLYTAIGENNDKKAKDKKSPALTPSHSVSSISSLTSRQKSPHIPIKDSSSTRSSSDDIKNNLSARSSPKFDRHRLRSSSLTFSEVNADMQLSHNLLRNFTPVDSSSHKTIHYSTPVSKIPKFPTDKKDPDSKSETPVQLAHMKRRNSNIPQKTHNIS